MFANHFSSPTKLFQAANTEVTTSAMCQVMYADAIAGCDMLDIGANFFDPTCNFVPKRYRQMLYPGNPSTIMFVGPADPTRCNPNQNV
jgi:hypothetical protein